VLEDAAAAGVVAGAAADALVGVTAGALVVAAAGAVVAVEAGVVAGAVPEAAVPEAAVPEAAVPEAGDAGAVKVNAGDGRDVALVLLADAVLGDDTMLATRTPTPSAAPLSSVTRGMLTFMPSNTQSGPLWVRWPGPGG